jgi:putative membrane protein
VWAAKLSNCYPAVRPPSTGVPVSATFSGQPRDVCQPTPARPHNTVNLRRCPPTSAPTASAATLYDVGEDPDARFTLANERTFLAWIRTSLALVAAGLAVEQLLEFGSHADRLIVALPLMGLGAAAALSSYHHWEQTERAIRLGQALPYSRLPRVLAYGIGLVTIAAAVLVAVDAFN